MSIWELLLFIAGFIFVFGSAIFIAIFLVRSMISSRGKNPNIKKAKPKPGLFHIHRWDYSTTDMQRKCSKSKCFARQYRVWTDSGTKSIWYKGV
jgi:hypothetical protein